MIDRAVVGKDYPPFAVTITEDWLSEWHELCSSATAAPIPPPALPTNWPAIFTLHGTACLMNLWEDLEVDPLEVRLVREEFEHLVAPVVDQEIKGRLRIEEISDHVEPETGIEEQVDLTVEFHDRSERKLAAYHCSYRIPRTQA